MDHENEAPRGKMSSSRSHSCQKLGRSEVLSYWQASKVSLPYCHGRWQRHDTPGLETKDFILMA